MPYKIVGRGVVAQHPIEERENQKKNNKNHYRDDNSYAVDIAVMTKMIVVYIIVNVETSGGKNGESTCFPPIWSGVHPVHNTICG